VVVPAVGRKEKTSDLGKLFFVLAFVELKNKNKIIALRTSCLRAFPVQMSCYPTCAHKFTNNIAPTLITSA
jgi:hypothetical protein